MHSIDTDAFGQKILWYLMLPKSYGPDGILFERKCFHQYTLYHKIAQKYQVIIFKPHRPGLHLRSRCFSYKDK